MKQFLSFILKETKHILRDKRTMLILFGMPVVLMFIFGFAITTDVRNVRTVVVTSQMDHLTQQAVERLAASEYFTLVATVATPQDAERMIRNQKADLAVVFANDFASKKSGLQFVVDGRFGQYEDALHSSDAFGLQFCACHHGYVADAHLCHDDQYQCCSGEGERHHGGAACLACKATDGDCR